MDGKLETGSEDPSLEDFDTGFREQRRRVRKGALRARV